MTGQPKHWQPPAEGSPNSQARAWVEYRARVREAAAARFCDQPSTYTERYEDTGEIKHEELVACGKCATCEAHALINSGRA